MKSIGFFLIFLVTAQQVLSQEGSNLLCYDCDPRNNLEACNDPAKSGAQLTNCEKKYIDREVNSTLICLSAHITFFGDQKNSTGIYRGCHLQTSSVVNFCDWFKQETDNQNALLVSCRPCNNTRCNSITFDQNGQPNSSPEALSMELIIALLIPALSIILF